MMTTSNNNANLIFIGSYAEADTPGLYACRLDNESGHIDIISSVEGLQNPTFLELDKQHHRLYTILEEPDGDGGKVGLVAAYQIDAATGTLTFLNKQQTVAASTCHITLDQTHTCSIVSSYHGGLVGINRIEETGYVGLMSDQHQLVGSSILPAQTQSRAHSAFLDPTNRYVIVSDLGADKIIVFKLDLNHYKLIRHSEVNLAAGSGPRHFVFHPDKPYGYVINELNSTVTGYTFDSDEGRLEPLQTISTLPPSFKGESYCADIHISPDGKFLYGSNRGHDSIVVYAIDSNNGHLKPVQYAPTLGGHPRNFAISPDGQLVLAANRDANNVVSFKRDAESGELTPTGNVLTVSKPVCIKFL